MMCVHVSEPSLQLKKYPPHAGIEPECSATGGGRGGEGGERGARAAGWEECATELCIKHCKNTLNSCSCCIVVLRPR